jgi:hypothetical protein
VSTKNTFFKPSSQVNPSLLVYAAVVPMACTNGIMNVGEQALSTDPAGDNQTELPTDHDSDTDTHDTSTDVPECEDHGVHYADHCWYLGERGESCIDVCEARGGYNEATATIVGSPDQGGSWEACRDIVRLMGFEDEVGAGYRDEGEENGFGCHFWEDVIWWLYRPDLTPEAGFNEAQRICSCHATNNPMR